MSAGDRIVALVGRPNVGKSRLFNRLAGRRLAIVHDQPGVTRDVNVAEVGGHYTVMDTGGIGLEPGMGEEDLAAAAEEQVFFAIGAAQLVLFVVDGRDGMTALDATIMERLRLAGKAVVLAVNKIDRPEDESRAEDFSEFGIADTVLVSAEHNRGISALETAIVRHIGPPPEPGEEGMGEDISRRVRLCFVGRPNVGKSSLCNRLLRADRLVVNERPGTTRDAIALDLDYSDTKGRTWRYCLIDTAGMRRRTRIDSSVEYFSGLRSAAAVEEADVVFHVIDALDGVTKQDKNIGAAVIESGRPCAVLVNKWDLAREQFESGELAGYDTERAFREAFEQAARKAMFYLPQSPFLFVSARSGAAVGRILRQARELDERATRILPTPKLNRAIAEMTEHREPRYIGGKRFRIYYAVQVGTRPPRIRLFCNRASKLEDSYRRYLENGLIERFSLGGCSIRFEMVGKAVRYAESTKKPARKASRSGKKPSRPANRNPESARKPTRSSGKSGKPTRRKR